MLLQGTDSLHQCSLEVIADTHNLTGCLHLCGQSTFCSDKFIERQSGDLYYTVVQCRLEAGIGLVGNGIFDFIQSKAQCDLRCYLCDRITGRLTCQCGRTADTGVNLDNTIFKAGGMQCKLYVTSTGDLQFVDDLQSGST